MKNIIRICVAAALNLWNILWNWLSRILRSFRNFLRSSYLAFIIVILLILVLFKMDQAVTLMVDMVENDTAWISLFFSFYFVFMLALLVTHYPIYTYYFRVFNDSHTYIQWHQQRPFSRIPLLRWFVVFTFTIDYNNYTPDLRARKFRYSVGYILLVYWLFFIYRCYEPNLVHHDYNINTVTFVGVLLATSFPLYFFFYRSDIYNSLIRCNQDFELAENEAEDIEINIHHESRSYARYFRRIGSFFTVLCLVNFVLMMITILTIKFSLLGLWLLSATSVLFVYNYFFFRLLRTSSTEILACIRPRGLGRITWLFFLGMQRLENSVTYILQFHIHAIIAFVLIIYSNVVSARGGTHINAIPILMAYLYFYYFTIANIGKLFAANRYYTNPNRNRAGEIAPPAIVNTRGIVQVLTVLLVVVGSLSFIIKPETTIHQISTVAPSQNPLSEPSFISTLDEKKESTLFFIASHGGGLKANAWTLNVLNHLQRNTEGKLLDQTIALSGASGGSLGLALYTGLSAQYEKDFETIQDRIDEITYKNYTSIDISSTFGLDFIRKWRPLNNGNWLRDRSYFKMREYRRSIELTSDRDLGDTSYRDYWNSAYSRNGYYPTLIMNTAGTTGSRGILWSVKTDSFSTIFPFAVNLADLSSQKTIPFYEAVSMTNRFPVLSPAAKVKGYGHYIDAGAIDNSGILGCLDLHLYLLRNYNVLRNKKVTYIEIINSKGLYAYCVLQKFMEEEKIDHIFIDEVEKSNLGADLQSGISLDKIPGYLGDFMGNWERAPGENVRYYKLFLPHKIEVKDIEKILDGAIENPSLKDTLASFLKKQNRIILNKTDDDDKKFIEPWKYYEPTLSRHLSKSSVAYIQAMLEHPVLKAQFDEIEALTREPVKSVQNDSIKEPDKL